MNNKQTEIVSVAITLQQAEVLAAIQKATKQEPIAIVTLDKISDLTGFEKPSISQIISLIKKVSDNRIIRNSRSQEFQGFELNPDFLVTRSLTARILLELRDKTKRGSISLEEFRKYIVDSAFYQKVDKASQTFDKRIQWAAHPAIGYVNQLETIEGNISASQRVNDESFYLEKIALKST